MWCLFFCSPPPIYRPSSIGVVTHNRSREASQFTHTKNGLLDGGPRIQVCLYCLLKQQIIELNPRKYLINQHVISESYAVAGHGGHGGEEKHSATTKVALVQIQRDTVQIYGSSHSPSFRLHRHNIMMRHTITSCRHRQKPRRDFGGCREIPRRQHYIPTPLITPDKHSFLFWPASQLQSCFSIAVVREIPTNR